MTFKNTLRIAGFSTLLFACAGIAAAQGPVFNDDSTSANLEMSATVQTALQLNISTGSGGATVSGSNATGLFSVGFGNINGLGLGTPATGVTVSADGAGAVYTTPINLTPIYSGFTTETADVAVSGGVADDEELAVEGATTASLAGIVTPHAAGLNRASGVAYERVVGFSIPRTQAARAIEATLIYTVTMALD